MLGHETLVLALLQLADAGALNGWHGRRVLGSPAGRALVSVALPPGGTLARSMCDDPPMWQLGLPPLEIVARSVIVYAIFLAALRIFGKREIGQFTLFDLALVLLAANALQPAITGPDQSIPGAAIIIVTIFVLNGLVSALRRRVPFVRRLLEFQPTVIGRNGAWLPEALDKEGLDEDDLGAALREHGLDSIKEMKLAVLEQDGSLSIVPTDGNDLQIRARRRRYKHHA
jgi:uncharacterized membrane protein YcaP (DUF421 family)